MSLDSLFNFENPAVNSWIRFNNRSSFCRILIFPEFAQSLAETKLW